MHKSTSYQVEQSILSRRRGGKQNRTDMTNDRTQGYILKKRVIGTKEMNIDTSYQVEQPILSSEERGISRTGQI